MRLSADKSNFLTAKIKSISPDAEIYLFGSRTNDRFKGGDIDICILSNQIISKDLLVQVKIAFFKIYGIQKLDILNYTLNDDTVFKQIILSEALKLG
jgi:predicted nucleotidyltransferase